MIFKVSGFTFRSSNRWFFGSVFMECTQDVPRRSQDVPRRPQDAPKTPQDVPWRPKRAPRCPQDAPRTPQDASRSGKLGPRFGIEKRFPAESPPDLDFGASWARFWEVLGSIFGGVEVDFSRIWDCFGLFRKGFECSFFTKQHEVPDTTRDNRTLTTNKRASRSY